MLSIFSKKLIHENWLSSARKLKSKQEKEKHIENAFEDFDRFKNYLNHIFDQFSINWVLTRSGFIPRQERKILDQIYIPTLEILSDSKWGPVNEVLKSMFQDYREGKYQETITKAHSALHNFLQIRLNAEKKNGKGELGKLFNQAKEDKIIPNDNAIINAIQSFVSSERAIKSTAKPALKPATSSDALLIMNAIMIFLQYCLK